MFDKHNDLQDVDMIKKVLVFLFFLIMLLPLSVHAQKIGKMEFKNQNIVDILTIISDMAGRSIIIDPSVSGRISFYFNDSDYEDALEEFCYASNLFVEKRNSVYYVSKVKIVHGVDSVFSIFANDMNIESLVSYVSKNLSKTILFDDLPRENITLHLVNTTLPDFLGIVIRKYPEYEIVTETQAYYIKKNVYFSDDSRNRAGSFSIKKGSNDLFSLSVPRGSMNAVIRQLFNSASLEFSLLNRVDVSLENLYFTEKDFDSLLELVLEQGNCDYIIKDNIYYIFEIQRKDILKNLKDTEVIHLENIAVSKLLEIFPNELNTASFLKTDPVQNSVYLTGSTSEIQAIRDFILAVDSQDVISDYTVYSTRFVSPSELIAMMPKHYLPTSPIIIPNTNSFIVSSGRDVQEKIERFIKLADKKKDAYPVYLKYIQAKKLLENLPPSIKREDIIKVENENIVFFVGTKDSLEIFKKELEVIDRPRQQIRYQMLIIQYKKSDGINWNKVLSVTPGDDKGVLSLQSGENLLKFKFDIISKLGYSFAATLTSEIAKNNARVLADTTIIGLSGEPVSFQNTSTYRYTEKTRTADTNEYLYITREITSGIFLKIDGWVSGDNMITLSVDSKISKQTESDNTSDVTLIPGTSEKSVVTKVRTNSGKSIIIGGLLQTDRSETIKKIPILGHIPILGRLFQDIIITDETSEMVIYITPYLYSDDGLELDMNRNVESFYLKYLSDKK